MAKQGYLGAFYGHKTGTTDVSSESIGTGDGSQKTFSGSLTNDCIKKGTLSITDGTETFTDNGNGVLTGDAGGTGTINYASGAYSVTFNTAPSNGASITADYTYWTYGTYVSDEAVGTGDDSTKTFDLDHSNIGLLDLKVYLDGTETKDFIVTVKGQITFTTAPANGVAITADYTYWDVEQKGGFRNWSFSLTGDVQESTDFSSSGWKTFVGTQKGWTGSAEQFWQDETYKDLVGELLIVKFYEDESSTQRHEGWAYITGIDTNAAVDTLIMQPISFQGVGALSFETS